MTATKLTALLLAALMITAGAGTVAATTETATAANEPTDTPTGEEPDEDDSEPSLNLDVDAAYENGTVDLSVTDNGTGLANVSVETAEAVVGETDADGSLTFETNATDELELALTGDGWSAEYEYAIENGSLVLEESDVEFEDENDGDRKGPDENASATAHTVFETIQDWLDSGRDGNLGRLVGAALGHGGPAGDHADDNRPDRAGGNGDAGAGDERADEKRPDHAGTQKDRDEKPGNGNADEKKGHGAGNAQPDDANDDETDEEDEEDEDSDE